MNSQATEAEPNANQTLCQLVWIASQPIIIADADQRSAGLAFRHLLSGAGAMLVRHSASVFGLARLLTDITSSNFRFFAHENDRFSLSQKAIFCR